MEQILKISRFILDSFIHIWPYLLITIPLAVFVNLSGASKYINKTLNKNPYVSIILATLVGAISPFCSCGVIPVISALLIGGVPLAPVMSFWIASPSMDPEIFLLSVATVGWKLSVWRLISTFLISLSAGYITHFFQKKAFLNNEILRLNPVKNKLKPLQWLRIKLTDLFRKIYRIIYSQQSVIVQLSLNNVQNVKTSVLNCCVDIEASTEYSDFGNSQGTKSCSCGQTGKNEPDSMAKKIAKESWEAFIMVAKFMALAFLINALIKFYLPVEYITGLLDDNSPFSVLIASLIGIPFYTSNATALPMVGGLLTLGMNKGAALAFLIAGPTTTLPAMMAVWGIVKPKVFLLYISFVLFGSFLMGILYNLIN